MVVCIVGKCFTLSGLKYLCRDEEGLNILMIPERGSQFDSECFGTVTVPPTTNAATF
jgi:hypothetical protein